MQNVKIENLSSDQRDQLLSQLLAEEVTPPKDVLRMPASEAGKAALDAARDAILSEIEDGGIKDSILEATQSIEAGFDDDLWDYVAAESFAVSKGIEEAMLTNTIDSFEFIHSELQTMSAHLTSGELLAKAGASVGKYADYRLQADLRAQIAEDLPQLIEDSVSWTINTAHIGDAILGHYQKFMTEVVLPNVARNIREAEIALGSGSSAAHSFNIQEMNTAQSTTDNAGGA